MTQESETVTVVTRNKWGIVVDVVITAGLIYYVSHPEVIGQIRKTARRAWRHAAHRVSVWSTRRDIRSLPELGDDA